MEMNFCYSKQSVAFTLSMVVLFSVAPVETACNRHLNGDNCIVYVAAYGFDDWHTCGYVNTSGGSSEETLDPSVIERNRGIVLFELDPITCITRNRKHFDTYGSADDRVKLVETLELATTCTIFVGVSADSAENDYFDFRKTANLFFTMYNMNLTEIGLELRTKFVFIMQKDYPKKTKYQIKPRSGECLQTYFTISGNTVAEVIFSQPSDVNSARLN